ncbi:hypothetical protein PHLCEN_2v3804 [Hermanssonia centrifuga]|uniref:Uncharacterized protein n=1 Tax=Hermanssonia centrifuga TaxID=98765 RepID=A0A2R6QBK9_9APHY|nr:hypothetical protein PHLCEN_2v3804 [Hermanssonia centrifuga]
MTTLPQTLREDRKMKEGTAEEEEFDNVFTIRKFAYLGPNVPIVGFSMHRRYMGGSVHGIPLTGFTSRNQYHHPQITKSLDVIMPIMLMGILLQPDNQTSQDGRDDSESLVLYYFLPGPSISIGMKLQMH